MHFVLLLKLGLTPAPVLVIMTDSVTYHCHCSSENTEIYYMIIHRSLSRHETTHFKEEEEHEQDGGVLLAHDDGAIILLNT